MSQSASSSAPDEPRPASTVIVLRDAPAAPEVFMVQRHEATAFMAGAHVFPGGRVDAADREAADERWCDGLASAAAQLALLPPADAVAYHVAALRELFEEAGVLLARDRRGQFVSLDGAGVQDRFKHYRGDVHAGSLSLRRLTDGEHLRLALDALVPFAHWVTPPVDVRRFDTRFFVTRVPAGQTPVHDDTETTHSTWITAADAIARCRRDEILLPPPTWTTLREIERFRSVDEVMAWVRTRRIVRRAPELLERGGEKLLLLAGDPLYSEPATEIPPRETRFVLRNGRWRAEPMGA